MGGEGYFVTSLLERAREWNQRVKVTVPGAAAEEEAARLCRAQGFWRHGLFCNTRRVNSQERARRAGLSAARLLAHWYLEEACMGKPSFSTTTIHDFVETRLGTVVEFRSLPEGLASQAFSFQKGTDSYVIRVGKYITGFRKDQFVYQHFASAQLPIPPVLEVGNLDDTHAFCITRRMPGVRVYDVEEGDLKRLVPPLVQLLASIAAVDIHGTSGYGSFEGTGTGPHASWSDFLLSIMDPQHYDWAQVADIVPLSTIQLMYQHIAERVTACPENRQLIHGDFGSYNVLTDGQEITAVLDWDRASYGDALYDVGQLLFWEEDHLRPLIAEVVRQGESFPNWQERVVCYQLRIGLQEVFESATGVGPIDLQWLLTRCQTIVEQHPLR
jgi:hygromycin-B 4-O-kinase